MIVGLLLIVSLVGVLAAVGSIGGWSSTYRPEGVFESDRCTTEPLPVTSRVTCTGLVTPEADPRALPASMVGPQAAFGSRPPVGGELITVYFREGDTSEVYPVEGRTTELIRMLLGRFDSLFILVGSVSWLFGWYLTRHIPRDVGEFRPYRYRFPQRFGLQTTAAKWMAVGIGWWLIDRLVLDDLLGTVGLG